MPCYSNTGHQATRPKRYKGVNSNKKHFKSFYQKSILLSRSNCCKLEIMEQKTGSGCYQIFELYFQLSASLTAVAPETSSFCCYLPWLVIKICWVVCRITFYCFFLLSFLFSFENAVLLLSSIQTWPWKFSSFFRPNTAQWNHLSAVHFIPSELLLTHQVCTALQPVPSPHTMWWDLCGVRWKTAYLTRFTGQVLTHTV